MRDAADPDSSRGGSAVGCRSRRIAGSASPATDQRRAAIARRAVTGDGRAEQRQQPRERPLLRAQPGGGEEHGEPHEEGEGVDPDHLPRGGGLQRYEPRHEEEERQPAERPARHHQGQEADAVPPAPLPRGNRTPREAMEAVERVSDDGGVDAEQEKRRDPPEQRQPHPAEVPHCGGEKVHRREHCPDHEEPRVHREGGHGDHRHQPRRRTEVGGSHELPDLTRDVPPQRGEEPDPRQDGEGDPHPHPSQEKLPHPHAPRQRPDVHDHRGSRAGSAAASRGRRGALPRCAPRTGPRKPNAAITKSAPKRAASRRSKAHAIRGRRAPRPHGQPPPVEREEQRHGDADVEACDRSGARR